MELLLVDDGKGITMDGSRLRLIRASVIAFQTHGYHASGLAEILAAAGLPKGSLYHHFPGGKPELAVAAIAWLAGEILAAVEKAEAKGLDTTAFLERVACDTGRWLEQRRWEQGALLAVLAQETAAGEPLVAGAVADTYGRICAALACWLDRNGNCGDPAGSASAAIALIDGAIAQARAARSQAPLEAAARRMRPLLSA